MAKTHFGVVIAVAIAATFASNADAQSPQSTTVRFVSQDNGPPSASPSDQVAQPALKPITGKYGRKAPSSNPNYAGKVFQDQPVYQSTGTSREWGATNFNWAPTRLAYRPLYFEDVNLERHGLTWGVVQPAVSAGHALGRAAALPYMMTKYHPNRTRYALGHDRPGTYARYRRHRLPDDPKAAAVEAVAIVGAILIFP